MDEEKRTYLAIDLKSFYASVECRERGLDPLNTNLVVADKSRTEKTICLAVSPSLKSWGIPGRPRLFEVVQKVKDANRKRQWNAPQHAFTGKSHLHDELMSHPELELDYLVAPPRMALYVEYSTRIYDVYLKYFAPEDIVVYSIDEVFIDATAYLKTYKLSARDLTMKVIQDVLATTGITATGGIGSNLYLAKVAMDIVAKRIPADKDGVRIAEIDECTYREKLWTHMPITDFWRVGKGYARRLAEHGMYTMGDVAKCSYYNEKQLYDLFGINAELLIDHAWGWEPCTMDYIKVYRPTTNCLSSGQVLHEPYTFDKALLVATEMADMLALDLVAKHLVTDQLVLTISYDIENLKDPEIRAYYKGEIVMDAYGRTMPKHAHGTINLDRGTSSSKMLMTAVDELYHRIVDEHLLIRKINITANHVVREEGAKKPVKEVVQLSMFDDIEAEMAEDAETEAELKKEHGIQEAMIKIKEKYGKNAILKGMNLEEGATAKDRNEQIGGHKA